MELRVLGCHGGETAKHRTSSFLVDGRVAIDAGAVASMLSLEEQRAVEAVLVSHAHLDHVRDLASLAENRALAGGPPFVVAGLPETLAQLRAHFFNDVLWPDFTKLPTPETAPVRFEPLPPEQPTTVAGMRVRSVHVSHSIEACGFVVESGRAAVAYSGDTGPTDRFWEVLASVDSLRALLMEVSFPNEMDWLAKASGHHTPASLTADLAKLRGHPGLPVLLYHLKPVFEARTERELAALPGSAVQLCRLGDQWVL